MPFMRQLGSHVKHVYLERSLAGSNACAECAVGNCFWWAVDQTVPLAATAVMSWMWMKTYFSTFLLSKPKQQWTLIQPKHRNCWQSSCVDFQTAGRSGKGKVFFPPSTWKETRHGSWMPSVLGTQLARVDEDSVAEWKYVRTSPLSRRWWWATQYGDTIGLLVFMLE